MDKIVIVTGHSEGSERYQMLMTLFTLVFPECEIEIISVDSEIFATIQPAPEPSANDM